jgi:hypothetical protein
MSKTDSLTPVSVSYSGKESQKFQPGNSSTVATIKNGNETVMGQ